MESAQRPFRRDDRVEDRTLTQSASRSRGRHHARHKRLRPERERGRWPFITRPHRERARTPATGKCVPRSERNRHNEGISAL